MHAMKTQHLCLLRSTPSKHYTCHHTEIEKAHCNRSWNRPRISQPGPHKQNKNHHNRSMLCPQSSYLQDAVSYISEKGPEQVIRAWCLIPFPHSGVTHCRKCVGMLCWECGDDDHITLPAHTFHFVPLGNNSRGKGFRAILSLMWDFQTRRQSPEVTNWP